MKALLAGYGGIGSSVYYPELIKLGYKVDIYDPNVEISTFKSLEEITESYDMVVICTPNFTHEQIARKMADLGACRAFIEKPGLHSSAAWKRLCRDYPTTKFHLVKNNLYRTDYGDILSRKDEIIGVDINWLNKNRIPNPGSWFTNHAKSFGGVSRDLMPHLICFAIKMFEESHPLLTYYEHDTRQRWKLYQITHTDYGTVNPNGIYNVDDYAEAYTVLHNVSLKMTTSWKEGYDKQSITVYYKDGSTYEWEFGLCPSEAYGLMLQDTTDTDAMDYEIHRFLEKFDE